MKTSTEGDHTRVVSYNVESAKAGDFKDVTCVASNDHGVTNKTVKVTEVGKSVCPDCIMTGSV